MNWEIVAETPWWFYLFFFYLIFVGVAATKARYIDAKNFYFPPYIFLTLSILVFFYTGQFNLSGFMIWTSACTAGILFGWLHFRFKRIKALPEQTQIYLPGTYFVILCLATILILNVALPDYVSLKNLFLFIQGKYTYSLIALYGAFTGLLVGRLVYVRQCLKRGPYVVG